MSPEHEPRADDHHVEPLYAAVRPSERDAPSEAARPDGPGLAVRLVLVALVALGLLLLVLQQAF